MWVIVEGPDYSGKTTLVDALRKEIRHRWPDMPVEVLHRSRPIPETRRQVLTDYVLSVEERSNDIVLNKVTLISDRWHFGERTYAPTKRPHTNTDGYGLLGVAGWRWTELFLLSRGACTVWLKHPLKVLLSRSSRGDDYVAQGELEGIRLAYRDSMKLSPSRALTVSPDPVAEDMSETINEIIDSAAEASIAVAKLRSWPEYIGSPTPSVLLVGDRRNVTPEFGDETHLPFMPVAGNSGNFLLSALPESLWQGVGLVNGFEVRNTLKGLWAVLGKPPIVALGRQAELALKEQGFTPKQYRVLPHPQAVKRFRYAERDDYAAAIELAATKRKVLPQWLM